MLTERGWLSLDYWKRNTDDDLMMVEAYEEAECMFYYVTSERKSQDEDCTICGILSASVSSSCVLVVCTLETFPVQGTEWHLCYYAALCACAIQIC